VNASGQNPQLRPLDLHFAGFIAAGSGEDADGVLAHSAALLSYRAGQGDVCVDLAAVGDAERYGPLLGLSPEAWAEHLQQADWVGAAGESAPLVLEQGRLYLHRFWRFEHRVAECLQQRLVLDDSIDQARLKDGLNRLFNRHQQDPLHPDQDNVNWQRLAAAMAVLRRFAVISGGPGTGKTTTVVKVLALLLEQNPALRIVLAAPTGKAAARLSESVRSGIDSISGQIDAEVRAALPTTAATIHRLLRPMQGRFRHHRGNPLLIDCLLLDEASMIDLPLMAQLLDALPPTTRVILLGDRDQLASVEAGSVLADITGRGTELRYSAGFADQLAAVDAAERDAIPTAEPVPDIANAIALLRIGYRFSADSGIGRLAGQVNQRQGEAALATVQSGDRSDLVWMDADTAGAPAAGCIDWAAQHYSAHFAEQTPEAALARFEQARVLCAMRQGPFGVTALNERITASLARRGLVAHAAEGGHYRGRPILVTRNDYASALFNGDIGLIWPGDDGIDCAWFPDPEAVASGQLRAISLHRLPQHETAWCLSVHKSQGSEFEQVLLVLPNEDNPVLSRELLYTGITRAKRHLTVHASGEVFVGACGTETRRSSGLADLLGW